MRIEGRTIGCNGAAETVILVYRSAMQFMKFILYVVILFSSVSFSRADDKSGSINNLIVKIRDKTPAGWRISYEKQYNWLEVSRDESILSKSAVPNSNPNEEGELRKFSFAFRISSKMPFTEFRKLSEENLEIKKKMKILYDDLAKRHISRKFDEFSPVTESDKKLVNQYHSLKKSMHNLPDFYFQNISLTWAVNSPTNSLSGAVDPKLEQECNLVRTGIENLLLEYK